MPQFLDLPKRFVPARATTKKSLSAGSRVSVVTLDGPGCIRRLWVTMAKQPQPAQMRQIILRIYWDDAGVPAVEAPVGDFFGILHGLSFYPINSRYIVTQHSSAYTAFFPMPFHRRAHLEVEAGPAVPDTPLYVGIDWHRYPAGSLAEEMRFHAAFRREFRCEAWGEGYRLLDATGQGRLLGFNFGVRVYDDRCRWSHAGGDAIYIANGPGELDAFAHLRGGGGEDVFSAGYGGVIHQPSTHLDHGIPYYTHEDTGAPLARHRLAAYRFFHEDAIAFDRGIHVRFGAAANDICSTAYWYQTPPHRPFVRLPEWPKLLAGTELRAGECDLVDETPRWRLCGPFHPVGNDPILSTYPPETAEYDPGVEYDGGYPPGSPWRKEGRHIARWRERPHYHGFVDFGHAFRPISSSNSLNWPAVGLAETFLEAEADMQATLHIGWANDIAFRLNDGVKS